VENHSTTEFTWQELLQLATSGQNQPAPFVPEEKKGVTLRPTLPPGGEAIEGSDRYFAKHLASRIYNELVFTPEAGWLYWDGHVWKRDLAGTRIVAAASRYMQLEAQDLQDRVMKAALIQGKTAQQAETEGFKASRPLVSKGKITAVAELAKADSRVHASLLDFDADAYVLNTPAGTVDLFTGQVNPPTPRALNLRSTNVAPDFNMATPLWDDFLAEAFVGEPEESEYLLDTFALALIGAQDFQYFLMLFGVEGAGKGVGMRTLAKILGQGSTGYCGTVAADTFLQGRAEKHEEALAVLKGVRLLVASETNKNSRFDAAKLKNLTGGDTITARFMYKDRFEFEPSHTLFMMTNWVPEVAADDGGFWRRYRQITYRHRPAKVVLKLDDIIASQEGPGILAALILRCGRILHDGLRTPEVVLRANTEQREKSDNVQQYFEECVEYEEGTHVLCAALWEGYASWCAANRLTKVGTAAFWRAVPEYYEKGKVGNQKVRKNAVITTGVSTYSRN
jgi:putative DNA primase/helicase